MKNIVNASFIFYVVLQRSLSDLKSRFHIFISFWKFPDSWEPFCLPYSSLVLKRFDFGLTLENAFCNLLHRHQNDQNSLQPHWVNPQGTRPKKLTSWPWMRSQIYNHSTQYTHTWNSSLNQSNYFISGRLLQLIAPFSGFDYLLVVWSEKIP